MAGEFGRKIGSIAKERESRLILALDVAGDDGVAKLQRFAQSLSDCIVGVKIGIPFLLTTPPRMLEPAISELSEDLVFIADAKLADVSHVNELTSEILFNSGFDAVICHGFIGKEGGLDGAKRAATRLGKGILVLVSMSHKASERIIDKALDDIIEEALSVDPDGIVAPATRPSMVTEIRRRVPKGMPIVSPGIGPQGAPFGSAIRAGADYEIAGRALYGSDDPAAAARAGVEEQRKAVGA
jgi:orotidine-5'-phosphate decarboxylase